ncbi:prepilin-type N-terminal cleavage/methylation domain-containing protein [Moritella sp.]|uniref:pilus assembly FimT family protein n=1 Tax=Moritella sp. TaxID=78556 RepID=UPI001D30392F|nr:prepilin-type N-terminal cleavage/methylation domain-containing protein [Moritella sp.]MCJ8351877.1 prepilin-type N-terminal cleavage/methylation domain-containing protein [Moritella sp.]NQZ41884.1 prepilin-type N-terminal cleavage/methylation domain-containing protein [Moritella sp.]
MNEKMGFSLLELTFVIVVLSILAMFAVPEYTKTHREAKVAVLNDLRGKLTSAVDTLKTASNIESRKQTIDGQSYVQYDARQYYLVAGKLLHPSEICHILGLTTAQLAEGVAVTSIDGMYTCKYENVNTSWIKMNKLESTDCALSYAASYSNSIITAVDIKLVGDCLKQ